MERGITARSLDAVVFVLLALFSLGTSYSVPRVTALLAVGNSLVAVLEDDDPRFWSFDGHTWTPAAAIPEEILRAHEKRTEIVDPVDADRSYRVDHWGVLVSADRGATWADAWTVPEERRRYVAMTSMRAAGLDISAVPGAPSVLVAAMGNEGVLIRDADGTWTMHGLGATAPTPQQATTPQLGALFVHGQWAFAAAAGLACWWLASLLAWGVVARRAAKRRDDLHAAWSRGLLETICAAVVLASVVPSLAVGSPYPHQRLPLMLVAAFGSVLVVFAVARGRRRIAAIAGIDLPRAAALACAAVVATLALFALFAWDLGRIPRLDHALGLTAIAVGLGVIASAFWLARVSAAGADTPRLR